MTQGFFLFKALKTTEHFKIPFYSLRILQSSIAIIHKALPLELIWSEDH